MSKLKIKKPSQLNMRGLYKFEKWTDLNNFENGKFNGLYKVSSMGRVYSVESGRILKPHVVNGGYLQVILCKNRERQQCYIHRLVAIEFIPNPDDKPCIDHLDVNRKNNRVENLNWVTYTENMNNVITLANKTNCKFMVIPYCVLDDGKKLPLAVYKGLHQASREVKSYSENVSATNIRKVLKSYRKTCGKIKITEDTSDKILSLIATHNLEGKKIYWTYIQDLGEFDLEEHLNSLV